MTGPPETHAVAERGATLALVKRALVALGACPEQWWRVDRLGAMAPVLAGGSRELEFPGPAHIPRRIWQFASTVDWWIARAGSTLDLDLDGMDAELGDHLEQLAEHVEGWTRSGWNAGERIFGFPGWLLVERVRLNHWKPGTSITEAQEFLVDGTGIRWLWFRGQEQNYGGKYVLPLRIDNVGGGDEPTGGWVGESDTARRIASRGREHWREFVAAAHRTRVFRAMQHIGRDDLRTALWLSRRVTPPPRPRWGNPRRRPRRPRVRRACPAAAPPDSPAAG